VWTDAAYALRPAAPADGGGAAFRQALGSDPDGVFVAENGEGAVLGRAAGSVRGDTLRVTLEVEEAARERGVGSALFDAVRAHGAARGATALETEIPLDAASLAFAAKKRLPMRTLVLSLELAQAPAPPRAASALRVEPFTPGAGLSGWVANLERETRGYALTPDWTLWLRRPDARAYALRRGGRPEGIAAIFGEGEDAHTAHIGPLSSKTPTSASAALAPLSVLARASGAKRVTVSVSADAHLLLDVALALGFRVGGARALLSTRPRGDLRRTLGGPAFF
jgi:GNAT superfamily N-acetyltransferase